MRLCYYDGCGIDSGISAEKAGNGLFFVSHPLSRYPHVQYRNAYFRYILNDTLNGGSNAVPQGRTLITEYPAPLLLTRFVVRLSVLKFCTSFVMCMNVISKSGAGVNLTN